MGGLASSSRLLLVAAMLVAPRALPAEPAPGAWPDGCVDRVEGRWVVVIDPQGEEHPIASSGRGRPPEGACFRQGRPDPVGTERRRRIVERLIQALSEAPEASEPTGKAPSTH